MFARHTSTRMKGSAVVQGLKSLAAKLHPQLPLSAKESQRLLTALTSSFRQRLDQEHPTAASEGGKSVLGHGASKSHSGPPQQSSALYADKHLASVLTSPLLAKGVKTVKHGIDTGTVKVELARRPDRDPISYLEELQEKGQASVPIANVCLQAFIDSLNGLTPEAKQARIRQHQAGKRSLAWLWNSKMYLSRNFVDDLTFKDLMTPLVINEGHEDYLWDWLQVDMSLQGEAPNSTGKRPDYHLYRWKGRVLRAMVAAKLPTPESAKASGDAALTVFLRACEMRQTAASGFHLKYLPLAPAGTELSNALWNKRSLAARTDYLLYDKFCESLATWRSQSFFRERETARLSLHHPTQATAKPALAFLRNVLSLGGDSIVAMDDDFRVDLAKMPYVVRDFMIQTAAKLGEDGHGDDAAWVVGCIANVFPKQARNISSDMERYARESAPTQIKEVEQPELQRVPMPTFV